MWGRISNKRMSRKKSLAEYLFSGTKAILVLVKFSHFIKKMKGQIHFLILAYNMFSLRNNLKEVKLWEYQRKIGKM